MKDSEKSKAQLIEELQKLRQEAIISNDKTVLLKYNKFIACTKNNISFIRNDYLYFDVNQTYLNVHNLKRENVVGKSIQDIFGEETFNNHIKNNVDKCLLGKVIKYQKWFEFPKNEKKYMDVVFHPFYDQNDVVIGVMVSTHDITNLKLTEEKVTQQNTELTKLNATKDKFFSIIAHDLKSPFNTMLGFSNLLVEKFDSYEIEKQKRFIGILNNDIHNTYKLLENLLMWSQSQNGTIDFKPEKENLYLLAVEIIDLLSQMAENKGITVTNKMSSNIFVNVDKYMLATIIRNLISNAIKFTPKGGTIEIGVDTSLGVSLNQNSIQIYVKDSGIGIKPEKQDKIFSISENTSTKGTENETGTGLGLILCKEFVEKHEGEIWIESREGAGSKFIFTLPLI